MPLYRTHIYGIISPHFTEKGIVKGYLVRMQSVKPRMMMP